MRLLTYVLILILGGTLVSPTKIKSETNTSPSISTYVKIKRSGVIKIGVAQNYPPLRHTIANKKVGLEVEMAKALGRFFEVKVKFIEVSSKQYISAVVSGEVDIIIAGVSRSLTRAKKVWFSTPYLNFSPAVLVDKRIMPKTSFGDEFEEVPFKTLWDLRKLSNFIFAVKKDSVYEEIINENFDNKKIKLVKNNAQGLELLNNGEVNGFVQDSILLNYWYNHKRGLKKRYKLLKGGRLNESLSVVLPFNSFVLKNQIDLFILELVRKKKIANWLKKYTNR